MRWILIIAGVFGICGVVAISYWRQSSVEVSSTSIIVILVLLPSIVVAGIYGAYRLAQWFKAPRQIESDSSPDDTDDMNLIECSNLPWFHIYATTVQTQLGEHADQIIAGLKSFRTADCDDELLSANCSKLLSRRIGLTLNQSVNEDDPNAIGIHSLSARAIRINVLTQNIYNQLDSVLASLAGGMAEAPFWQLPSQTTQALLHPAWQGKEGGNEQIVNVIDPKSVWPKIFNVLYMLPNHLTLQDQHYLQEVATAQMMRYGFHAHQMQWSNQIVKDADETLQNIEQALVAQLSPNEPSMLLIMGIDSHVDQELIDSLLYENNKIIPAEASFSLLMTNDETSISTLPILSQLTVPILKKRQKPISLGGQLRAEELNTGLDELQRHYLTDTISLIPEHGILVTDINPTRTTHLRELTLALRPFDLPTEDLIYTGSLLESTDAMASGVALAIALQQSETSKLHVPLICSAGDASLGIWLAAPYSQILPHPETFAELSQEISEHA